MIAAGIMLANVILSGALCVVVTTQKVQVFTAFVDPQGLIYRVEKAGDQTLTDDDLAKTTRQTLGDWIRDGRSVYADWEATRLGVLKAYQHTSGQAHHVLLAYHKERKPEDMVAAGVTRTITSIDRVSLLSDKTWQIIWREEERERGKVTSSSCWNATITMARKSPATEDEVQKNALGLYVDAANIGRDVTCGK
jgi:type IV secretory pathway TrbF-like protein